MKPTLDQIEERWPGAIGAWVVATEEDNVEDLDAYVSGDGSLRATDCNGGTYTWEDGTWICHECGSTPEGDEDPSVPCAMCNRG